MKNHLTHKNMLIIIIIFAGIAFSIIPLTRVIQYGSVHADESSFYHERMSELISEKGIPEEDPLMPRSYLLQPYHLLLSFFVSVFGAFKAATAILFWIGIISAILVFRILEEFGSDRISRIVITGIFIFSPATIYLFSISNPYALSVFLFLAGFYLLIKGSWASLLFFSLLPFFHPFISLASIMILMAYSLNKKESAKKAYTASFLIIFTCLIFHLPFLLENGLPFIPESAEMESTSTHISDLGADFGIGIFTLLLSFLGLFAAWQKKKQLIPYIFLVLSIILSFYYPPLIFYISLALSLPAGYGFMIFVKRRWSLELLKKFTIVVLICGIIFSSISYTNRVSNQDPYLSDLEDMRFLLGKEKEKVFSHPDEGYLIQEAARKPVFLDSNLFYLEDAKRKLNETREIFYSRNLETTSGLLRKNNISYIWITDEMKKGEVWEEEDEGLLFLLNNNETFKKLYSSESSETWQVLYDEERR